MNAHRPENLYKFCSAEAGLQILSSNSLRWSAPCCYRDPMELDHHSTLGFSREGLLAVVVQTATSLIFAKDAPRGSAPLLTAVRRWRDEERFASPEEATEVLSELLQQVVDQRQTIIDETLASWVEYSSKLRICSFSEKPDNPNSWLRFASNHRGLALRFAAGEDSELPVPVKVNYRKARPQITSINEEIGAIINANHYVAGDHFAEKYSVKPDYCSAEKEWRCFRWAADDTDWASLPDHELVSDIPFSTSELKAVYFGVATPEDVTEEVKRLLSARYRGVKLYQARLEPGKYSVALERL